MHYNRHAPLIRLQNNSATKSSEACNLACMHLFLIKCLALFLKRRLRKADPIGRPAGEEIAVILPDIDIANACKVLDDIRSRFAEINCSSEESNLHCALNCDLADLQEGMDVKRLTRSTNDALSKAKKAGRH